MAAGSSSYGTGADEAARLAALQRAAAVQNAGGGALPFDTTSGGLTSGGASTGAGTYSGANPTGAAQVAAGGGALPYDMDALRRAAAAEAEKVNAANAARTAGGVAAGGGALPFSTDAAGNLTGSGAVNTGANTSSQSQSNALARAATGGSVQPPSGGQTQLPTTLPTAPAQTTQSGTSDLLAKMTTNTPTGTGLGAGRDMGDGVGLRAGGAATNDLQGAGSSTMDQGGDLGALTQNITSQLQSIGQSVIGPNASPDVTGVFLQQSQAILKMLDEQEAQLRAENQQQGTTIDPATQFTIDKMREGLNDQLKTVREDLNRRGLNDSGILLELENRLQKGSLSDQSRVLAERLTALQDQLTKGLAGIRSQRYDTASSFGRDAAQAQFSAGENQKKNALDREQSQLQGMLGLRSQVSGENTSALNRAFQGEQSSLDRSFNSQESALQRAYGEAQSKAQTTAQFDLNKQKYEQDLALAQAKGSGGSAISRAAGAAGKPAASAAGDVTSQAIADLRDTFTNANEANAAIKEQMRELAAAGVDIAQLQQAAQGLGGRRIGTDSY